MSIRNFFVTINFSSEYYIMSQGNYFVYIEKGAWGLLEAFQAFDYEIQIYSAPKVVAKYPKSYSDIRKFVALKADFLKPWFKATADEVASR